MPRPLPGLAPRVDDEPISPADLTWPATAVIVAVVTARLIIRLRHGPHRRRTHISVTVHRDNTGDDNP